jgi:hypothetical protein
MIHTGKSKTYFRAFSITAQRKRDNITQAAVK